MATRAYSTKGCILLASIITTANAIPAVAFPFNSQVPTVARVGVAYEFQFSSSTFIPEETNFTYSISGQPGWLLLDGPTRTLSGTPSSADVGGSSFTITAADDTGAAHMPCVVVVSPEPAPAISWSISSQLATSANLSSSQPPVVTLLPSTPFHFSFSQNSFIDSVPRKLTYYATLTDHTPLPAWLMFDAQSISLSGTAPQLSAFPQSWEIDLIASDVIGFAGAAAPFTIAIGAQQLVFVPEYQTANCTAGNALDYSELSDSIYVNGNKIAPDTLRSATATGPSWLDFDARTLQLSGTVPSDFSNQNVTVTVVDHANNTAMAIVALVNGTASLFAGTVPSLTAFFGKPFSYQFPESLFTAPDISLMMILPASAKWLHFDPAIRTLSGEVPTSTVEQEIQATLTAKSAEGAQGQSQTFTIKLLSPASSTTSRITSRATATHTPKTQAPSIITVASGQSLSTAAVAGIIAGTIVAATIIALLLICCWRGRKSTESYVDDESPRKKIISRPILPFDAPAIAVTTHMQTDVEKLGQAGPTVPPKDVDLPPQIALDLPGAQSSKRMKWSKRFSRISHASSIGNGEDAIRADDNIPVLGRESIAPHTPHDSFSVPTDMARSSRLLSNMSPTKRALRRLQDKRQSRQSIGLGIHTGGASLLPRHSSKGARTRPIARSSTGRSTLDRSSMASFSTQGTELLSTKASEFPRPPTRSTLTASRSIPTLLALTEDMKRKSIRVVGRSDSTLDDRPLQEKRQSFIRNRASTSLASPLFAHGMRLPSETRGNGRTSVSGSLASSRARSRRGKSQLTTYSESSSLEPPPRDPRRLSQKVGSVFAPSFPRAVTKSNLEAEEADPDDGSSQYTSTESEITENDLAAELALPRHQRSWVLPGEASPTPEPEKSASRQSSAMLQRQLSGSDRPRQKWKERLRERSSSPLSTAVAVPVVEPAPAGGKRRSRLSEPLSLVSNDSLSRGKLERPRLVHNNSKRPVSMEKVQRLSSLKAETDDARPGSEMWEAMEEAGMMPPKESWKGTGGSKGSGIAFL